MAYSTVEDLLTGDLPLPVYLNPEKFIADAADEIDSVVGQIYVTPVDMSDSSAVVKPARLLLKRISNYLASGRLLLAAAVSDEDTTIHAYGASLIKEATVAMSKILNGDIKLLGATFLDSDSPAVSGPRIFNQDARSGVDAFYSHVMADPGYLSIPDPWRSG